jgi:hypothetical protein
VAKTKIIQKKIERTTN